MRTTEQTRAAPDADGPTVAIIVGSTRPGRKADTVAQWVHDIAARRKDATRAQKISSFDAFVFVTPEYNGSISGAPKDAVDFLYAEWNDKAAGFVGHGIQGGVRAVEHLRQILRAGTRHVPQAEAGRTAPVVQGSLIGRMSWLRQQRL